MNVDISKIPIYKVYDSVLVYRSTIACWCVLTNAKHVGIVYLMSALASYSYTVKRLKELFALKLRITDSRYTSCFCLKLKMLVHFCCPYFTNNKNIPGKISRRLWCIDSLSTVYLFSAHRHSLKELLVNWDGCMHSNPPKNGHSYFPNRPFAYKYMKDKFFPAKCLIHTEEKCTSENAAKSSTKRGGKRRMATCRLPWYVIPSFLIKD